MRKRRKEVNSNREVVSYRYRITPINDRPRFDRMIDFHSVVEKKKGAYYLPKSIFAVCNFDLSLLPVKLSLPMVCPPLKWDTSKKRSLIVFAGQPCDTSVDYRRLLLEAASFHYKSFSGKDLFFNQLELIDEESSSIIKLSREAKRPFFTSARLSFLILSSLSSVELLRFSPYSTN